VTLLAHAIAAAPPAALSPEGLRGRPLAWSEAGDLGLWSTEWAPDLKLERPDALEHHRLVERICAAQPCLPVRFGTAFASSDDARASLDKRSPALHAALTRVAGKSELALTLLWREPPAPPVIESAAGPGRQYMETRRGEFAAREARRARAESLVEQVISELAIDRPLVWHETCTSENVAVSLAVLVPTERAPERKAELERVAARFTDVVPVLNGPWPPYTFARTD
jgi:gas vesicle protein GvpL/GvpF